MAMKSPCSWEVIHGFSLPAEYERLVRYIGRQLAAGEAEELHPDKNYGSGEIFGGRWFRDNDSGEVWRLVPADFPFRGLWEPIDR